MGKLWGRSVKKQENVSLDRRLEPADGWNMAMADTMREKLTAAFAPDALEIVDESAKHAGHAGARPGGETHFAVRIVSKAFEGVGRVERQRRVYAALADELKSRVHALSLTTLTPAEAWHEH
jgi:BolA family transcriptional regulator, general stress-responsive regulator